MFNGTQQSCRNWQLSLSGLLMLTVAMTMASSTRTVTSRSYSPTVQIEEIRAVLRRLIGSPSNGGRHSPGLEKSIIHAIMCNDNDCFDASTGPCHVATTKRRVAVVIGYRRSRSTRVFRFRVFDGPVLYSKGLWHLHRCFVAWRLPQF